METENAMPGKAECCADEVGRLRDEVKILRKQRTVSQIDVVRLEGNEDVDPPSRANEHDAGLDLRAAIPPGEVWAVSPGESLIIPTGYVWGIAPGNVGLVCPRSGMAAKHQVTVGNAPGVVDSGYRGEVKVILQNHGTDYFRIQRGDRIAQMLIVPVVMADIALVDSLDDTERGDGGFGSSGNR